MKLVSFTDNGSTRAGVLDASGELVTDLTVPMIGLLSSGDLAQAAAALLAGAKTIPAAKVTLNAPVPRPGKALAIGLNYRDHAEESGQQIPKYPVVFAKVSTCITGPGAPIERPLASVAVDWEAELCFVIGRRGRHIPAADAMRHVAGFMCGNDVSVRDWQFHNPTWVMGKGFDTHGPTGPWLVTSDEVDPRNLDIKCLVNGALMQSSNTSQLIFDIPAIIEYLSTAFTLEPGDVVFTGTPAGVGISRKPPVFLKAGDVVRVEIDGLGALENHVVDEAAV
jgi:2-keto-4-pentenoate hydratase/2-oxohepta-3-ene-1,7-dioic acid hydratase in catechol pathway